MKIDLIKVPVYLGKCVATLYKMRKKRVDFLVIGAQKAGTTALDAYLRMHPAICLPKTKELHYFDNEKLMSRSRWVREFLYHANFISYRSGQLLGEVTPNYLMRDACYERIKQYRPDIKLIVILRDPVKRAYSQWNMQRKRGWEKRTFEEAVRENVAQEDVETKYDYVGNGMYGAQCRKLIGCFHTDQILVLMQDDLMARPSSVLNRIAQFLGVESFPQVSRREEHIGDYEAPLERHTEAMLRRFYCDDLSELESLFSLDLSGWKMQVN